MKPLIYDTTIHIKIDKKIKKEAMIKALNSDTNLSDIIRDFILNYISDKKNK